jgi:hypothetical protein
MLKITLIPRNVAKFLVAFGGLAGEALSLGLVPTHEVKIVTAAVGLVTAVGVYLTRNGAKPANPSPAAGPTPTVQK